MQFINKINSYLTLSFAFIVFVGAGSAAASDKTEAPELPAVCSNIKPPAGQRVANHVYATGAQIYRWSGSRWELVAPAAKLYADESFRGLVGEHFAGPTWESTGVASSVIGVRRDGCTPDPTAIPWLILKAVNANGDGIFGKTTFIQRVNTSGGLEPAAPGAAIGVQQKVAYLAEYYFYEADN